MKLRFTGFFHRVGGVFVLSLREELRTRTVLAAVALLAFCVLALPHVIKGDGTPEGYVRILLSYTLGFGFWVLAIFSLWTACSLFAAEIDSRRIVLSRVKPTGPLEFWLGKWLAIVCIGVALLALVYAGVYAQLRWRIHGGGWDALDRPACRFVTRPDLPPPEEEARQVYALMQAQHALPTNQSERAILKTLAAKATEHYSIINPGEEATWSFTLAHPVKAGEPIAIRIRFDTEFSTRALVIGACRVSCAELPAKAIEVPLTDFTQNEIEFALDTSAFLSGDSQPRPPLRRFTLSFAHQGDAKKSSAIMLRYRKDVAILTPGGPFELNLARSALVQGCVLALLAAFGLTLSAILSLPVAVFTATVSLALCLVSSSAIRTAMMEEPRSWKNLPGIWISCAVDSATRHTLQADPLTPLARGERLPASLIAQAFCWNVVALPAAMALIAAAILKRREMP